MNRRDHHPPHAAAAALLAMAVLPLTMSAWWTSHAPGLALLNAEIGRPLGLRWLADGRWSAQAPEPAPARIVLLVHGLDEPGGIWDQLAPALADRGHTVARFDYPNDQAAANSATLLLVTLDGLTRADVTHADIVAHSMGGLVARDALTRPGRPDASSITVPTLICLGTPHAGSPWAAWQPVAELREQVQRLAESDDRALHHLFGADHDGHGEAAVDLTPGSAFLTDLDARNWPATTRVVCVVGVATGSGPVDPASLNPGARALGDGVVPTDSAAWARAAEVIYVRANHRSMVRSIEIGAWWRRVAGLQDGPTPPAVPLVIEQLGPPDLNTRP